MSRRPCTKHSLSHRKKRLLPRATLSKKPLLKLSALSCLRKRCSKIGKAHFSVWRSVTRPFKPLESLQTRRRTRLCKLNLKSLVCTTTLKKNTTWLNACTSASLRPSVSLSSFKLANRTSKLIRTDFKSSSLCLRHLWTRLSLSQLAWIARRAQLKRSRPSSRSRSCSCTLKLKTFVMTLLTMLPNRKLLRNHPPTCSSRPKWLTRIFLRRKSRLRTLLMRFLVSRSITWTLRTKMATYKRSSNNWLLSSKRRSRKFRLKNATSKRLILWLNKDNFKSIGWIASTLSWPKTVKKTIRTRKTVPLKMNSLLSGSRLLSRPTLSRELTRTGLITRENLLTSKRPMRRSAAKSKRCWLASPSSSRSVWDSALT